jgi:hypothetical protein
MTAKTTLENIEERFLDKVMIDPNSGCWLWTGCLSNHGYGFFRGNFRTKKGEMRGMMAHLFAWDFYIKKPRYSDRPLMHKCKVDSCVNPNHLYCSKDLREELKARIDKDKEGMKEDPLLFKFENRVMKDPNSGCWLWTGPVNDKNYGIFSAANVLAHRWSYERFKGPILNHLVVRHKCDTPSCVNPEHLEVGTKKDNALDCVKRGRSNKPTGKDHWTYTRPEFVIRGEQHGSRKLTEDQVRRIFFDERYNYLIAADYGINTSGVQKIKAGITWKHLNLNGKN